MRIAGVQLAIPVNLLGVLSFANFHQTRILLVSSFCTSKEALPSQALNFSFLSVVKILPGWRKNEISRSVEFCFFTTLNTTQFIESTRIVYYYWEVRLSNLLVSLNFTVDCEQSLFCSKIVETNFQNGKHAVLKLRVTSTIWCPPYLWPAASVLNVRRFESSFQRF